MFNLSASRSIHLVMAVAFTLIALVHWFDVRDVPGGVGAYLAWSAPAVLLLLSYFIHPARDAA